MANESIISIPPDLDDVVVLRRVLGKIVESLDIVVGTRANADKQYATQKSFNAAVAALKKATAEVAESVKSEKKAITLDQQTLQGALIAIGTNLDSINTLNQEVSDLQLALGNLEGRVDVLELNPTVERMRWLGQWVSSSYSKNDVVKNAGDTWIALVPTSATPGATADWETLI